MTLLSLTDQGDGGRKGWRDERGVEKSYVQEVEKEEKTVSAVTY